MQRLLQSIQHEIGFGRPRNTPTNDFVREGVDDKSYVNEALPA